MASFEGLYKFTDYLCECYKNAKTTTLEFEYLDIITEYYECLCKSPRLKDQQQYTKQKLFEICEPYARTYFKPKNHKAKA